MSKKKANEAPKFSSLKEAGLENYVVREMKRAAVKAAEYNPRKISDKERAKLKAALQRHGLVAPIVWNERTGNLVGGHQRISILDSLMGSQDYTLSVSVVDVDEKREKELNILLNNAHAMGSFDMEMLKSVFDDGDVSIVGAGFSNADMVQMFGSEALDNRVEDLKEFSETLSKVAEKYDSIAERNRKKGESEHFLVFVFPSGAHVDAFIEHQGLDNNRYQNGALLLERFGVMVFKDAPQPVPES